MTTSDPPLRIVVVEDDEDDFLILQDDLARWCRPVLLRRVRYAEEALDLLAMDAPPDLLLIDCYLPRMNGVEAVEKIRSTPSLAGVPIILLTGSRLTDPVLGALNIPFVGKPLADNLDAFRKACDAFGLKLVP